MNNISFIDLVKVVKQFAPNAVFFEDYNGHLHIATGLSQNGEDTSPLNPTSIDGYIYPFERDVSEIK
jgi:hypothetical protein